MATAASSIATEENQKQGPVCSPATNEPKTVSKRNKSENKGTPEQIKQWKARRREQRKRRAARRKAHKAEMQLAEKRTEAENQIAAMISSVQAEMKHLVESEKRKSEEYLSLARKYYTMWKTSNDERIQQQRASIKTQSPGEKDHVYGVSLLKEQNFMFPVAMTSVTMNKRFSDNTGSSGPFKILGETLNISNSI